jgi:carboxymethylenebutenolidase
VSEQTPVSIQSPDGPPKGGLVVVQEAFGVNDHIEDVCRRLAVEGWLAVAPHFFHRSGDPKLGYDDISLAMPHMQALQYDTVLEDLDAGLNELAAAGIPPERTGVVGFCMGGTVALIATANRDVGAGVTF